MPKPKDKRARRNKEPIPLRVIEVETAQQPPLPDDIDWHPRTREWWDMWGRFPLAAEFTEADWSYLLDTALIHTKFWSGDAKLEGALRLRVAKFGQTVEDRARLRITFAAADEADSKREARKAVKDYGRYEGMTLAK